MSIFNENSRTENVIKSSLSGFLCSISTTLAGFIYRTVFIHYLSANYLGVNGLFTNILGLLSIANLGIDSALIYRFYQPISEKNTRKVGELIQFMRVIYFAIGAVIFFLGLSILPFLDFFIKDSSEVPSDINLKFIYLLFLLQTSSTYLYSYRQVLLTADQKQYLLTLLRMVVDVIRYIAQIITLIYTKNYTLVLCVSIAITFAMNYGIGLWVKSLYRDVFLEKNILSRKERQQVYHDAYATMCHKVGGIIQASTDNLVISKFVGLLSSGLYANYYLLINGLQMIVNPVLNTFTSSIGNANVELDQSNNYDIYKRLLFMNLWIASFTTSCLFCLLNDFIELWIGRSLLLDNLTVSVLCIQYYIQTTKRINESYTNATGLFTKDKMRPFIEAGLNLFISVYLVVHIGIAGVFIGTILSSLMTVWWREPYLLHKYVFNKSMKLYLLRYLQFSGLTFIFNYFIYSLRHSGFFVYIPSGWCGWALMAIICGILFIIVSGIVFFNNQEFRFYINFFLKKYRI